MLNKKSVSSIYESLLLGKNQNDKKPSGFIWWVVGILAVLLGLPIARFGYLLKNPWVLATGFTSVPVLLYCIVRLLACYLSKIPRYKKQRRKIEGVFLSRVDVWDDGILLQVTGSLKQIEASWIHPTMGHKIENENIPNKIQLCSIAISHDYFFGLESGTYRILVIPLTNLKLDTCKFSDKESPFKRSIEIKARESERIINITIIFSKYIKNFDVGDYQDLVMSFQIKLEDFLDAIHDLQNIANKKEARSCKIT